MVDGIRKSTQWPASLVIEFVRGEVLRKADICTGVLTEARKLSQLGKYGPPLNALVARGRELLDDIDKLLVALDPQCNDRPFAATAALRRQLEQIEAATAATRRAQAPAAKASSKR